MMIIGCDFHPSRQQVSWLDTETGDCGERKLVHASGDAKMFYRQLGAPARRLVRAVGDVEPADRQARRCGAARGRRPCAGAVADDATGRGAEHGAGLCADHRRREPLSPGQAGGELAVGIPGVLVERIVEQVAAEVVADDG
jgi:hypothetical protein